CLKRYCRDLGIPVIGTHGLRHTTSELYLTHGATRDDLQQLFAHSCLSVTDRYVHGRGSNLEKVSNVIQLFPKAADGATGNNQKCDESSCVVFPEFPKSFQNQLLSSVPKKEETK